ncbi:uncharacterized protein PAC_14213 [Phialocephala subalpina]|uniref:Heterokaryon incompatibility domain-containing protein n=1 Tax=Phialocephala subalpina TaxID=576137 RepID=A0A1L7XGY3_9HELO|nr:uncharacterized protein PAC_14213 [Phialocephala subalpina]
MRVISARKWIEKQTAGKRPAADKAAADEPRKKRNVRAKKSSNVGSEPEFQPSPATGATSATNMAQKGATPTSKKAVNMSIVHGPGNNATNLDSNSSTFPYQPLNVEKSEIRIIILKPGTTSSPLECCLKHINPKAKPRVRYKALSYTWGSPEPTRTMTLDGIQIQVRENLWQALCHIRQPQDEVRLWVDAICINQENTTERNQQVSRMGTMYNQAEEVIVWLGPEKDESSVAISFIKHTVESRSRGIPLLDLPLDLFSSAEIRGTIDLFDRDYWQRVWIIQEVVRARKIIICCGHETLQWKDLAKFFRLARNQPLDELGEIGKHPSQEAIIAFGYNPAATLTDHRTSRFYDLETLLISYIGFQCCDPRDKVYSLLGLARNRLTARSKRLVEQEWLTVDYSRPPRDLFRVLTLMYLAEVGDHFAVRWMQLLQKTLDLPAPWTAPPSLPLPANTVGQITYQSYHPFQVSQIGPQWYPRSNKPSMPAHQKSNEPSPNNVDDVLRWYRQFQGSRMPTAARLAAVLESLNSEDITRLNSFKQVQSSINLYRTEGHSFSATGHPGSHNPTNIRLFTTHNGRVGLTSCDITHTDFIIRFHSTDIALVVSEKFETERCNLPVKGRAFIVPSDKTLRSESFLGSYNATFRYAVPSILDECNGEFCRDTKEGEGDVEEIEMYDDTSKKKDVYWTSMTFEEWEFWTW